MTAAAPPPVPGYRLSTDPSDFDVPAIHAYLTTSYWAEGVSLETVRRSVEGSAVCIGVFDPEGRQVGFARAVTDQVTFAWIADVYVLEGHRGMGLAAWMLEALLADERLQGLRRVVLATRDAHRLYEGVGFGPLPFPERWMQLRG
ncbi:MAG TPA: GNAT family N-acetyltransferase [Actinomycetota bacterium]|nr:GNAT family N-acetyltransferase [Actinomycetota bacterium]